MNWKSNTSFVVREISRNERTNTEVQIKRRQNFGFYDKKQSEIVSSDEKYNQKNYPSI